jgi:hypothetical protein
VAPFAQIEWEGPTHEAPVAEKVTHDEDVFNPFAFFTSDFQFTYE